MSNTQYVTLSRSSHVKPGTSKRCQDLMVWDVSKHPSGRFLKEKHVPSCAVRKFCRAHNIVFDTSEHGFFGTTIYARGIGGQMHFMLMFGIQIPLEDEWKQMIAARETYVAAEKARTEAERVGKLIKDVRINAKENSVTVTLNNGKELHAMVNWNATGLAPFHTSIFSALQADPIIGTIGQVMPKAA